MDKMNHIKEHIIGNTYERIIFITRLSAIGDVIISSHTIVKLIINGYYPVFITSHSTKDIALRINGLDAFICHQKGKNNLYYFKGNEVDEKSFLENINNLKTLKKHLYVDLQKTSRSKRALKFITNDLNINFEKKYFISKMTLYRFLLVILSYFSFKKKIKDKKLKFNRIHETQEKLVKKIILKDKNFYTELNKNHYILKNNNSFFKNNFDYITIFPGASGFIKAWPKEKFRELIQKIINQTNYHIIICGLTNEIYLGEYLDYPQQTRIINLVNK
ncbi:glycosyltransferase family 9 protein, partial [Silvanigrella sp.]|uniref:glycosyltransferase family 9 protein n=1 Tax=Silvanigrella sp. TaxID=2024976 RepID=UPI0037CB2C6F